MFEKSGLVETYTFTIDNVSTYVESMRGAAGDVTNSFFHVQVNDNKSGDFSNSDNGSMRTMALAAGSHDYSIVGSKSGTVASGTFTIKKDGDKFNDPNLTAAPIGNKTDKNTYDQLIKDLHNGAYVMPDAVTGDDSDLKDDIHGTAAQNRIFKFETTTDQDKVTLTIYAADGTVMYTEKEAGPFAVGPHFFYVQVTGNGLANAGTGPMETTGLKKGTYTWTVYSKNDGMLMQGVMNIAAEP